MSPLAESLLERRKMERYMLAMAQRKGTPRYERNALSRAAAFFESDARACAKLLIGFRAGTHRGELQP